MSLVGEADQNLHNSSSQRLILIERHKIADQTDRAILHLVSHGRLGAIFPPAVFHYRFFKSVLKFGLHFNRPSPGFLPISSPSAFWEGKSQIAKGFLDRGVALRISKTSLCQLSAHATSGSLGKAPHFKRLERKQRGSYCGAHEESPVGKLIHIALPLRASLMPEIRTVTTLKQKRGEIAAPVRPSEKRVFLSPPTEAVFFHRR